MKTTELNLACPLCSKHLWVEQRSVAGETWYRCKEHDYVLMVIRDDSCPREKPAAAIYIENRRVVHGRAGSYQRATTPC